MPKFSKAYLVLADGTVFEGCSFGAKKEARGEVVFNTSLTGYQEVLTDPSYKGQMVVMTYPEIGNYGVNAVDEESRGLFLSALIVKSYSPLASNFRSKENLNDYLKRHKVPGLFDIDTRALVRHIRDKGAQQALIVQGKLTKQHLKKAASLPSLEGQDLALEVSSNSSYSFKQVSPRLKSQPVRKSAKQSRKKYRVVAYDFGIKKNILRLLADHGCEVTVVPAQYPADKVLAKKPDGIFLSNGPGDPAECTYAIDNVRKLLGKAPMFGICLGHQIMGLALGANTYKLKFGHHGGNQPVMDKSTQKVEITAQNHGFAIDDATLPKDVVLTHVNLNDNTVEGIAHPGLKAFSVQYHPEAGPGPHDSHYLFERFVELMESK